MPVSRCVRSIAALITKIIGPSLSPLKPAQDMS